MTYAQIRGSIARRSPLSGRIELLQGSALELICLVARKGDWHLAAVLTTAARQHRDSVPVLRGIIMRAQEALQ